MVSNLAKSWWEVQLHDLQAEKGREFVTIHECATGKPARFSTQAYAIAFAKQFAANHSYALSEFRLVHVYTAIA